MNLLFDTNIILAIIRSSNDKLAGFLNPDNDPTYISIVSEAEIKSIVKQNSWVTSRQNKLDGF